jgi:hypothetical protein
VRTVTAHRLRSGAPQRVGRRGSASRPSRAGAITSAKRTSCPAPTRSYSMHSIATAARGASRKSRSSTSMCTPAGRRWWGWWKARGEGIGRFRRIKPMQNKLPMHLSRRCGARTRNGSPCRSAAMSNGRCRMHGGMSPGAPKGNKNAFKHGHYTAEAIASRREIAKLLRDARALVKEVN